MFPRSLRLLSTCIIMWYVFSEQPYRNTEDLHVCLLQSLHFYWNSHVRISFLVCFIVLYEDNCAFYP